MGLYQKKDTRFVIVETAIRLFSESTVEDVPVSAICSKANVTRNAFYYYFQTKNQLFDAIGDYITEEAKRRIDLSSDASSYRRIWEFYRPFLEYQIELGPDIMNHCCFSRTSKGHADFYSYVDARTAASLKLLIELAKANREITTPADPESLVWASYAVVRGNNIKWCFQWGQSDLIGDCKATLNTLFLPTEGFAL